MVVKVIPQSATPPHVADDPTAVPQQPAKDEAALRIGIASSEERIDGLLSLTAPRPERTDDGR